MSSEKLWRLMRNQREDYEFKKAIVRRAITAIERKDISLLYEDIVTTSIAYPEVGKLYYPSEFVIEFVVKTGIDRLVGGEIKKQLKE